MMALAGVELETFVSEPDALTTRPPHVQLSILFFFLYSLFFIVSKTQNIPQHTHNYIAHKNRFNHFGFL